MGAVDDLRDFLKPGIHVGNPINREALRLVLRELDMTTSERDQEAQRRLEAETALDRLRAALEWSHLAISSAIDHGRISCLCEGAGECDPHAWLLEIEQALKG